MSLYTDFTENNPTFEDIRDIKNFHKIIRFTKIASLASTNVKNAVADLIVKLLVQHLQSVNLFDFASIQVSTEKNVTVAYADDVYHFAIIVNDDSFAFARTASTIEDFLSTCDIMMPFFSAVYEDVVSYIQGAVQNIMFVPHFCGYKFNFTIEDFHPAARGAKTRIPNYELMERLVPSIEKAESPVSKMQFARRGRTDLKMSGTLELDKIRWLGWIAIEAPGNQNYSTMDISFELQSSTLDELLGTGKREPFNPQSIESWRTPFIAFLKDRAFCGFLQDWLKDVKVKSVR